MINDTNDHANNVEGTSRAAIIVAYFVVPAETKPTRFRNRNGVWRENFGCPER